MKGYVKDGGTYCWWNVQILAKTKILSDFFASVFALVDRVSSLCCCWKVAGIPWNSQDVCKLI